MATYNGYTDDLSLVQTGDIINFAHIGNSGSNTLPKGQYKLEVWGGGDLANEPFRGGKGGYAYGTITLAADTLIYAYAGGPPQNSFNNGGGSDDAGAGGDSSEIRLLSDSPYARVIVAGGGGGFSALRDYAAGGDDIYGVGLSAVANWSSTPSTWNNGEYGDTRDEGDTYVFMRGGGGGGWRGGRKGVVTPSVVTGGEGGSGFAYTSSTAAQTASTYTGGTWLLNSSYYLTNSNVYGGSSTFPSPYGGSETGHDTDGYVRITALNVVPPISTPTIKVKASSVWKDGVPYVKVSGAWKKAKSVYTKIGGVWKQSK